jgi:Domain of unknown function (DUF3786)
MPEQPSVFEKIHQDYLAQIANMDWAGLVDRLGVTAAGDTLVIPFFGAPYRVSRQDVFDTHGKRPHHAVNVILFKYLLLCPSNEPQGDDWVTYRHFKDAAPFVGGFLTNAERPISRAFEGRIAELSKACGALGGRPLAQMDFSVDLAMRFHALPKVPILLLFNDRDEDFPAKCSILFERRAEKYLDMECLAMLGWILADRLRKASGLDTP